MQIMECGNNFVQGLNICVVSYYSCVVGLNKRNVFDDQEARIRTTRAGTSPQ